MKDNVLGNTQIAHVCTRMVSLTFQRGCVPNWIADPLGFSKS